MQQRGWIAGLKRDLAQNPGLYIMVLAPLVYLIIFKYWPIYGVQIAFRDFTPVRTITGSPWVGLKHIRRFFTNYNFWTILGNTVKISLYSLATFPLPILFALLVNYVPSKGYKKLVQMVSYMPHFISTVVMVGIILQFLDNRNGLFNIILTALGGKPVKFLTTPRYFYSIYIWSGVWQGIGYSSIIYIASLAGVSTELHEAAIVDGASIVRRIWHIDLPGILPTVMILLIMRCGSILSVDFEKVYLMQNNVNGKVSEIISTYVYKQGMATSMPQYSYASAIGLFVALINVALLLSVNKLSAKVSGNSLW